MELSKVIIARDFKNAPSEIDKSSRHKISKDIIKLNNNNSQLDIIDIYRLLHPATAKDTLSKLTWNIRQERPHSEP